MGRRVKVRTRRVFCPRCRRCWVGVCAEDWAAREAKRWTGFPRITCGECLSRDAKGK